MIKGLTVHVWLAIDYKGGKAAQSRYEQQYTGIDFVKAGLIGEPCRLEHWRRDLPLCMHRETCAAMSYHTIVILWFLGRSASRSLAKQRTSLFMRSTSRQTVI